MTVMKTQEFNFDDTKIIDINDYLAKAQLLDMEIVYIKDSNFIVCSQLVDQLAKEKKPNVNRFFQLQNVIPTIQQLDKEKKPFIENDEGVFNVQKIEEHLCYFKIINKEEFKQYNGYCIHQDLYFLFMQWLSPEKFLQYSRLFMQYFLILTTKQIKSIEEAKVEQQKEIQALKAQIVAQTAQIELLKVDKLYFLTNPSDTKICKVGGTYREVEKRLDEINKSKNYKMSKPWEIGGFVPVTNYLLAERIYQDIYYNDKIQKNRELYKLYEDQQEKMLNIQALVNKGGYIFKHKDVSYNLEYYLDLISKKFQTQITDSQQLKSLLFERLKNNILEDSHRMMDIYNKFNEDQIDITDEYARVKREQALDRYYQNDKYFDRIIRQQRLKNGETIAQKREIIKQFIFDRLSQKNIYQLQNIIDNFNAHVEEEYQIFLYDEIAEITDEHRLETKRKYNQTHAEQEKEKKLAKINIVQEEFKQGKMNFQHYTFPQLKEACKLMGISIPHKSTIEYMRQKLEE